MILRDINWLYWILHYWKKYNILYGLIILTEKLIVGIYINVRINSIVYRIFIKKVNVMADELGRDEFFYSIIDGDIELAHDLFRTV